jgi:hypothetical protein
MRLRDFVSNSSYRINQIFPNETKFCAQLIGSGPSLYCSFYTAYINSSAPENYNILPNGIKFNFDTTNDAPGLIGNISYRMTNDSNYVRVDAAWKNTGGSAIVIRPAFQWSQKHPPHGYYRSDDGDYADTMITNPPTNIFSRKWISFWSSVSSDDLIGWIINNETDAIRYANFNTYFHILIYKQISTNLNPGDTYTMTFYIMSDQRGSSGQEWLPVNQTYCNIFWNTTYCGATK